MPRLMRLFAVILLALAALPALAAFRPHLDPVKSKAQVRLAQLASIEEPNEIETAELAFLVNVVGKIDKSSDSELKDLGRIVAKLSGYVARMEKSGLGSLQSVVDVRSGIDTALEGYRADVEADLVKIENKAARDPARTAKVTKLVGKSRVTLEASRDASKSQLDRIGLVAKAFEQAAAARNELPREKSACNHDFNSGRAGAFVDGTWTYPRFGAGFFSTRGETVEEVFLVAFDYNRKTDTHGTQIDLFIVGFNGVGDYTIGEGFGSGTRARYVPNGDVFHPSVSGTLRVTSYDPVAKKITGTFSFTTEPDDQGVSHTLTGGEFTFCNWEVRAAE